MIGPRVVAGEKIDLRNDWDSEDIENCLNETATGYRRRLNGGISGIFHHEGHEVHKVLIKPIDLFL